MGSNSLSYTLYFINLKIPFIYCFENQYFLSLSTIWWAIVQFTPPCFSITQWLVLSDRLSGSFLHLFSMVLLSFSNNCGGKELMNHKSDNLSIITHFFLPISYLNGFQLSVLWATYHGMWLSHAIHSILSNNWWMFSWYWINFVLHK